MKRTDLLSQLPIFAGLGEDELRELADTFRLRTFERGEILFLENDPAEALYVLQSGRVKLTLAGADGEETILHVAGPGESLGELSLVDGADRSATAVALDHVEALTLFRADFLALLDRHRGVERAVMKQLAGMVRRSNERLQDVTGLDISDRLGKMLLDLAERYGKPLECGIRIALPLTQQELARMLGLKRGSANKYLHTFAAEGLLCVEREGIVLRDPEALRKRIARSRN